jgi:release factor glutamine methyltransferase
MPISLLDSDLILSYVLNKPREYIYAHPEHKLTKNQRKKYLQLVSRRKKLEPIAYLVQEKEFFGLPFYVDHNVLIPRPDTEFLVEKIIKQTKNEKRKTICDIGTGSGCIAIALKKYLPQCEVIATDISLKALNVAKKNAKQLLNHKDMKGTKNTKIIFYCSNLFNKVPKKYRGKIDIIVANLPYLPKNVAKKQSLKYEPKIALQDKKYLPEFLKQAKEFLRPNGKIFLETNKRQINIIKKSGLNCEYIVF